MNTIEDYIYCIHCEAVYKESEELIQTTPQTLYDPEEESTYCPECHYMADDNKLATREQIINYLNY